MQGPEMVIVIAPMVIMMMIVLNIFAYKERMAKLKFQSEAGNSKVMARLDDVTQRLEKIERRVANVETIVIDAEKAKAFERSL